ncbi:hypothetical protein, partial [Streptomyces sp. NPDC055607]
NHPFQSMLAPVESVDTPDPYTAFRQLMSVSLPTTGSRFIGNLSWFFEPIVVAQSLAIAGVATAAATSQYALRVPLTSGAAHQR